VDYETACWGDPAMDIGLFLCHLLLKAVRWPQHRADYFALTRQFWHGYAQAISYRPLPELQARGLRHLAVCLLARIDGTSPVDYLPEEPKREAVRRIARQLLEENVVSWPEVLELCEAALRRL
jgi:5-methylthioribose kinase